MRSRLTLALASAAALVASTAHADSFGGFSKDGSRYLLDGDRVCEVPRGDAAGTPRCARAAADEIARHGFAKGTLERGAGARVKASASGTRIEVTGEGGAKATWDTGVAVAGIDNVYRSPDGRRAAVEYSVRVGGRSRTEVVVIALAAATASTAAAPTGPLLVPDPVLDEAVRAELARHYKAAAAQLKKKRWARAEAAARAALALDDGDPGARYVLAAAQARQGKKADAIATLAALAHGGRRGTPALLVDARTSPHFAALRADGGFRVAVGIDPDPSRPPSAYERLLGVGGTWEQPSTPCKQPEVGLALDRAKMKFVLTIVTRCQGDADRTRLGGRFEVREPDTLALVFPNPDAADEELICALARCPAGDEDCVTCGLDDLSFTLRIVRR